MPSSSNPNTSSSQSLIFQQIEQDADYYSPSVYQNLLTFHHSLQLPTDSAGNQFIPVSDAMNNPDQKKKLFVVGLIPPSSQVSGKILDRSNSIAQATPDTPAVLTQANALSAQSGSTSGQGGYGYNGQTTDGVPGSNQGPAIVTQLSQQQMAAAFNAAYMQRFGQPPTSQAVAMFVGQSIRETSGGWPNYNPGNIGNFNPNTTGGQNAINNNQTFSFVNQDGSVSYYMSYSTAQAGASAYIGAIYRCGGQSAIDAANNGDVQGYCQALYNGGYFTDTVSHYVAGFPNVNTIASNIGDVSNLSTSILPPPLTLGPSTQVNTSSATAWATGGGSDAANQSTMANVANINNNIGNDTFTGNKYTQQQSAMIAATQLLLKNMANTPPLRMIVNPSSFKVGAEKVISDGGWTRYGPSDVVEHWGEQQDKIDASGRVAAFQAIDASVNANGPGLTRTARQYSASYQNFLSLYQLYRNNGGLYLTDNIEPTDSRKQVMSVVGSIYIYYDHTIYIGSFDTFTITETDSAPFTLEYSFTFTVRATFLLDQISDPNFTFDVAQGGVSTQSPPTVPTTQSATSSLGTPASQAQQSWDDAYNNSINSGGSVSDAATAASQAAQNVLVGTIVPSNNGNS
jgi:hypothetical protein